MAYEVLARKYRSRDFDEIVGQSAIATTLKNAVATGRIHHGYLFTGTRGVGKTSMARILAKALNCERYDGPTPTPCGECESCRRIAEGADLDVVEIDAASNTGVDDIRELRGNVAYRPARSRYKVYIIDEVHMLSTSAFNALLKTLEEPPEHVKFILATTESHKVPATIKSRCQRFDFRSISPAEIAGQLRKILDAEGVEADDVVVRRISRLAAGSMRDALSLLDQLLAYGTKALTAELIEDLLPSAHDELIFSLFEAVAANDAAQALVYTDQCLTRGYTAERLCEAVIEYLRSLMLLAVCSADTDLVDLSGPTREQMAEQAKKFDAPTYVYMIGLMEEVRRMVKSSSAARALVDAAVVRLAMSSSFSDIGAVLARLDGGEPPAGATGGSKKKDDRDAVVPAPPVGQSRSGPAGAAVGGRPEARERPAPQEQRIPEAGRARGQVTGADRAKAMESVLVRHAIELSNGFIESITRHQPPATDALVDESVADAPPADEEEDS